MVGMYLVVNVAFNSIYGVATYIVVANGVDGPRIEFAKVIKPNDKLVNRLSTFVTKEHLHHLLLNAYIDDELTIVPNSHVVPALRSKIA